MEAWSGLLLSPVRPAQLRDDSQCPPPLPDDASVEVVHVLAAMTLGHIQGVYA